MSKVKDENRMDQTTVPNDAEMDEVSGGTVVPPGWHSHIFDYTYFQPCSSCRQAVCMRGFIGPHYIDGKLYCSECYRKFSPEKRNPHSPVGLEPKVEKTDV